MDRDSSSEANKRPRPSSVSETTRSEKRRSHDQVSSQRSGSLTTAETDTPDPTPSSRRSEERDTSSQSERYSHNREWVKDDKKMASCSPRSGFRFSLMTYNILSQDLIDDNEYLYRDTEPKYLRWKKRRKRIMNEIKALSPDIICLQEVQENHYEEYLQPMFKNLGYNAMYKKRTGDKPDGCALLFKMSKFVLEKSSFVEFFKKGSSLMNRDNVGLIAVLRAKAKSRNGLARVCVATTHILFNMKRGDVKLGQVCTLMAEIDKLMGSTYRCPLILCGDFNCHPFSPLYNFIVLGHLQYEGMVSEYIAGNQRSGRYTMLYKGLLPPQGIDERCRYVEPVENNEDETEPTTSDSQDFPELPETSAKKAHASNNTGHIGHDFKLVSAYTHFTKRAKNYLPEITTNHGRTSTTVDYVFYSVMSRNYEEQNGFARVRDVKEGRLKLLERYDLIDPEEARQIGCLPTHQFGSDHFSLMCKFHLDYEPQDPSKGDS